MNWTKPHMVPTFMLGIGFLVGCDPTSSFTNLKNEEKSNKDKHEIFNEHNHNLILNDIIVDDMIGSKKNYILTKGTNNSFNYKLEEGKKNYSGFDDKPKFLGEVDELPRYPLGKNAFHKYIMENLKYPEEAKKHEIEGKAFFQFLVSKSGKISQVRFIAHDNWIPYQDIAKLIQESSNWVPAKLNGEYVSIRITLPIYIKND